MLIFELASPTAIGLELGRRLRMQRLAQNLSMTELGERAGVSWGTVRNLETKGQASLSSVICVAKALGLANDLNTLFELSLNSIADMEKAAQARSATRARKAGR
ncbi:helix-turn-helix domain-containing protein [Paludibacterium purpuratum]|uniref:Helix-turn-helix protein n=1 Tax=Paludibacterium purpuratum TaxID=1144873 RepID=A0A4R7B2Q7_9NEIS|nr:helix-turn-helix transcriptional regulator [Paludibacterium purpuratum]TDR76444.1 helix-turn-helix protein [Paludibacterium purpuratum]